MRKSSLLFVLSATFFLNSPVWADDAAVAEKLAQMLSNSYGATVSAQIKDGRCRVQYPETKIEEQVTEYKKSPDDPNTIELEEKTVMTTLSATDAECVKIDDFKTFSQYHIAVTAADKLKAQFYNRLKTAFIKDIEIKSFAEDTDIVPELGLITSRRIKIADAAYTQTDETTGLKSEIGNLKNYEMQQQITEDNDKIKFEVHSDLDALNVVLPFFSLQIPSQHQQSEMVYRVSAKDSFDYADMIKNVKYLQSAETSASGNGLKIGVDIFDFGITLDLHMVNKTSRINENTFQTFGNTSFKNINFAGGDFIPKEKRLKSAEFTYSLENIPAETFEELGTLAVGSINLDSIAENADDNMTRPENTNEDADGDEMAKILNKIAEKANFISNLDLQFTDASLVGKCGLKRQNGYLSGLCKTTIKGLFNIFPQLKQCANNPKADEMPECSEDFILNILKDSIDITKNDSEIVYKFTDKGVFKNDVKIGEPVELDFEKIYREKQQKDKEREEMFRQMTEQQNAPDSKENTVPHETE